MSGLLGISVSGLKIAQTALSTTGHNIANAGVEGYSRQEVDATTNPATFAGGGFVGSGARVSSIERVVNGFLTDQLRLDTTLFKDLEAYHDNIAQLDTLLSDVSTGLSSGLESFFSSVQNGADDPTSIPARQLIISESENLADRFNTIYSRFQSIDDGMNEAMTSAVSQANALVSNIADLNRKIADAAGFNDGASPNDLLDQRDEALRKLSELVSIQVYDESLGQVNVVVGSGQNLVVGTEARQLELIPSAGDASQLDLVFQGDVGGQVITNLVSGGEIGGLIRFRDSVMRDTFNEFGRIAIVMADTFNEFHTQGITLDNEFGSNFFSDMNADNLSSARVIGDSSNAPPFDRIMKLNIADSSQLVASDYHVSMEAGGLFRIDRAIDGVEVFTGLLPGSFPFTASFDGLELVFEGGSFSAGDEFTLLPTRTGARDFGSALVNPSDIAFASPLLTDASIGNTGTANITPGEVVSLNDINGNALPLFQNAGSMNPPLIVKFTTQDTYDVLDNSDPGNPVQLVPPIRNQTYIAGTNNELFPVEPGETMVTTNGEMVGMPAGRLAVAQASILMSAPTAVAPTYPVTNFSGVANQFAFDVVVSGTQSNGNDGTFTVTVTGPTLNSDAALLTHINGQLSSTNVRAYIADNGSLAFRLNTPGYGDITLQNYNADPDGGGSNAPAGQANALLGFDIENSTFTTVADANGISGVGTLTNGYPAEAITITRPPVSSGLAPTVTNVFTTLNATVKETVSALNNVSGVSANAFNYIELTNFQFTHTEPLQISLNGEDLLEYSIDTISGAPLLSTSVPNVQTQPDEFKDYLAERINSNSNFQSLGIHAVAGVDSITGVSELRIYSNEGDDFQVSVTATAGETLEVSDGVNSNLTLTGVGNSITSSVVVGGRFDVSLEEGLTLGTFPPESMLFGDTTAADFAQSTFLGIQAAINGIPNQGDTFTLDFNFDAASDNRNALRFVNLETSRIIGTEGSSFSESYASLVEKIGIDTSSAKINFDASEQVLEQSQSLRNSVSAVNLDEEAGQLIKYEQMYSANAQVISVTRDLFDRLISSF